MRHTHTLTWLAGVAALCLAGCGGDGTGRADSSGWGGGGGAPGGGLAPGGTSGGQGGSTGFGAGGTTGFGGTGGSGGFGGSDSGGSATEYAGVDDDPLSGDCGYGTVYGVVCSKTAQMYVNGAKVWIEATDCNGNPATIETTSDGNGYFTLQGVPNGYQTVSISKDSFSHSYPVAVVVGQTTDITQVGHKECFKAVGGDCPKGTITGYVCAPNDSLNIGGATVYVEATNCNGKPIKIGAVSDDTGNFVLEDVPSGPQTVVIEKGSFKTDYSVVVPDGGEVHAQDVVQDACFDQEDAKIAVVSGDWDDIGGILKGLQIEYDAYNGEDNFQETVGLLSDLEKLKEYDIIFFNCGADHEDILLGASSQAMITNLQMFVDQGGSVYASDYAFVYVEWPWPSAINFVGGDMNTSGPKMGVPGPLQATVTDPALIGWLGKQSVSLNYDLPAWVAVESVPAATETHIIGSPLFVGTGVPLMVSHTQGQGKVLYTTFHNEPQVTDDMVKILQFLVFSL